MTVELGTVSHGSSVLAMSLDGALEAFTFGNSGGINPIADGEDICLDLIFYGILAGILQL